jgi:hypothetical protein
MPVVQVAGEDDILPTAPKEIVADPRSGSGSSIRRGMLSWRSGTASGWLVTRRLWANSSRMKLWGEDVMVVVETYVSSGFTEVSDASGEGGGPTVTTVDWLEAGASAGPSRRGQGVTPTSEPGPSAALHPALVTPSERVVRRCPRRLGPSQKPLPGRQMRFPAPRICDQESSGSTYASGGRWRTELERPNGSYRAHHPSHNCPGDRDPPCEAVHELGATVDLRINDSADTRAVARAKPHTRATALTLLS